MMKYETLAGIAKTAWSMDISVSLEIEGLLFNLTRGRHTVTGLVPWHLLEADHKNFFTRGNLGGVLRNHFARVEVFSYADHPLRTPDGIALHGHLFAVADK